MRERILLFIAPITKIIDCVTCYIHSLGKYILHKATKNTVHTYYMLCFLLIIHYILSNLSKFVSTKNIRREIKTKLIEKIGSHFQLLKKNSTL